MIRARRSGVWAEPTSERPRGSVGHRPQLAGPCPSLTGDEQAAGPRPTIDSGCVDENRTDLSRDSCHPTTHAPVSILLQPRTKKISPLVSAARSDFLFCRGSGSSNPRDGALMVCRRRRRPRHLIRFHQINVCVRPHSSDLCQKNATRSGVALLKRDDRAAVIAARGLTGDVR